MYWLKSKFWGEEIKSLISELYDPAGSVRDKELFSEIVNYVNESYKTKITLEKMEKKIGVNSRQIMACFGRSEFGSFSGYMKYLRCIKADQMLCQGKEKIKDIAGQCGFASENYFIKCIKEYSGKTPFQRKKEYQEEKRKFDNLKEKNYRKAIELLMRFMGEKAFNTLLKNFD